MPSLRGTRQVKRFGATLLFAILVVAVTANAVRGETALDRQLTLTNQDPNGSGKSTFTVYYHLSQTAPVGTSLVVPVKLYVANLTGLMSFLQDYTVKVTFNLNNGKVIVGQAGVNSTQAAENLGAGQLHAGQEWGPANVTIPLTESNTGLAVGQQALGNVSMRVDVDVWFNQPINFFRPEGNQSNVGYVVVSDGTPSGPAPNYVGLVLLGLGVIILAVSVIGRRLSPGKSGSSLPRKAPGSV